MTENYNIPMPIVDGSENESLEKLTKRYEKMIQPSNLKKLTTKAGELVPDSVKNAVKNGTDSLTETELFLKSMEQLTKGFKLIEQYAAKVTLSEGLIVEKVNAIVPNNEITTLKEITLARSYDLSKLVNKYKTIDLGVAFVEGGATGAPGFWGLPFNIVLSTFIFYRAVQSVAMFYGYDVKNDPAELEIASEVFSNAMSPSKTDSSEISCTIAKIMLISETTTVRQTVKKTWAAMAEKDAVTLLITQMRALANGAARRAIENAGKKGLEESMFKSVFEQIGKKLTKETVFKSVPYVSGAIGAIIDTMQMSKILDYADVFYNKRFIYEKEQRIKLLENRTTNYIEIDNYEEIDDDSEKQ